MGSDMAPFDPLASQNLGFLDRLRARAVENQATMKEIQIAADARAAEIKRELDHQSRAREQARVAQRTELGITLASNVYDSLVEKSKGDPSRAAFLAGIATRGRDAMQSQV
jgi:hypothetical protein